jgi:hypothetical protein
MRSLLLGVSAVLLVASGSSAETLSRPWNPFSTRAPRATFQSWPSCGDEVARPAASLTAALTSAPAVIEQDPQDPQPLHAAAIEHSDAYQTRAKIHKYASFATLPLFAAEVALGESLYNTPAGTRVNVGAHAAVGAGIVGLFGLNTVTGAWNLFGEGWQDKDGRTLRVVHGLLMMASDVGFLATEATGPKSGGQGALTFETAKATHRNIAFASIGVATAGYLIMLFGNH